MQNVIKWSAPNENGVTTATVNVANKIEFDIAYSKPGESTLWEIQISVYIEGFDLGRAAHNMRNSSLAVRHINQSTPELYEYLGECLLHQGKQASWRDCRVYAELWIEHFLTFFNRSLYES